MATSVGREGALRLVLRTVAIVIAIAAAIDPAITTVRRGRPIVSVAAINAATDSALALQVARQLSRDARIVPAPFSAADASILVGDALPAPNDVRSGRTFIVRDDARPRVTIESVRAPRVSSLNANRRIDATIHTVGARDRALEVLLTNGDIVIDRVQQPIADDTTVSHVELSFVPTAAGASRLRVEAAILGVSLTSRAPARNDITTSDHLRAVADVLVDVVDRPLAVLVYDPRPSWISTFVRRALERDQQFVVTSRVVTSRSISTSSGSAPDRLDDPATLDRFTAIVVGAPEALSDRDVAGLETFMRRRGGSVVMLLDQRANGAYDRLTGVREWRYHNDGTPIGIGIRAAGGVVLRSAELLWPALLPDAASAVAQTSVARMAADSGGDVRIAAAASAGSSAAPSSGSPVDSVDQRPVIWRKSVGAGRLVVSGALDAWRFRDTASSNFDRAWQVIVADAAGAALPPLSATLSEQRLLPGEKAELSVIVRDAALRPVSSRAIRTSVSAVLESGARDSIKRTSIQLWPDGAVGSLHASFRAPHRVGLARIIVSADGHRMELPLVVDSIVSRPVAAQPGLSEALAASHGGKVIMASQLSTLKSVLARSINAGPRRERWHPMRSVWWILPFAVALSAEWWLRRRRGMA